MSRTEEAVELRLVFDVHIQPNGVGVDELKENLARLISHGLGDGWVTGPTPAEVLLHSTHVTTRRGYSHLCDDQLATLRGLVKTHLETKLNVKPFEKGVLLEKYVHMLSVEELLPLLAEYMPKSVKRKELLGFDIDTGVYLNENAEKDRLRELGTDFAEDHPKKLTLVTPRKHDDDDDKEDLSAITEEPADEEEEKA